MLYKENKPRKKDPHSNCNKSTAGFVGRVSASRLPGFAVLAASGHLPAIKVWQGAACTAIVAFSELFAQLWLLETYTIQGGAQSVSDAGKINMDALAVSY